MLSRERSLWIWCALPVVINLIALALGIVLFFTYLLDPLSVAVSDWLEIADPERWYQWLWVAPLRLLSWLARWAIAALFALLLYMVFVLLGGVLAAPFLDVLSRRVEALRTGRVADAGSEGLVAAFRVGMRAILEEGKRVVFFLGVQAAILALGLVPGLHLFAAVAWLAAAAAFLPLDYAGYLLDRRGVRFRERRRWIWRHRGPMLTFGLAALGTFAVPILNFLCLPWLVTAGTLLALEVGPPSGDSTPQT
jgi:CysZ protein